MIGFPRTALALGVITTALAIESCSNLETAGTAATKGGSESVSQDGSVNDDDSDDGPPVSTGGTRKPDDKPDAGGNQDSGGQNTGGNQDSGGQNTGGNQDSGGQNTGGSQDGGGQNTGGNTDSGNPDAGHPDGGDQGTGGMALGCQYSGQTYAPGETFPAGDGCNNCTCSPTGTVACTLIACLGCNNLLGCASGQYCNYPSETECGESGSGQCEVIPDLCTRELRQVCACDGATYNNPCQAAASGQSIRSEGPCP